MKRTGWWVGWLVGWLVVGCSGNSVSPSPTPILPQTTAVATTLPTVAPTPLPDSGWVVVQPGLEQRTLYLFDAEGIATERLLLLRLAPEQFIFRVAYRPGAPLALPAWQAETGALLVVNGGYFTPEYQATGLIIVDGQPFGSSYGGFAGMLAIDEAGPTLRWLAERPFDPAEQWLYALQSFPMLVQPGGVAGFLEEGGQAARRTAVAQDRDGRLLFIFAPWGSLTLHQFSRFLAGSDLDLVLALNLDGGSSTGMVLASETAGAIAATIPAFTALPVVITVETR